MIIIVNDPSLYRTGTVSRECVVASAFIQKLKMKMNNNKKKKNTIQYNTVQLKDRNNTFENIVFTRVYYFD